MIFKRSPKGLKSAFGVPVLCFGAKSGPKPDWHYSLLLKKAVFPGFLSYFSGPLRNSCHRTNPFMTFCTTCFIIFRFFESGVCLHFFPFIESFFIARTAGLIVCPPSYTFILSTLRSDAAPGLMYAFHLFFHSCSVLRPICALFGSFGGLRRKAHRLQGRFKAAVKGKAGVHRRRKKALKRLKKRGGRKGIRR